MSRGATWPREKGEPRDETRVARRGRKGAAAAALLPDAALKSGRLCASGERWPRRPARSAGARRSGRPSLEARVRRRSTCSRHRWRRRRRAGGAGLARRAPCSRNRSLHGVLKKGHARKTSKAPRHAPSASSLRRASRILSSPGGSAQKRSQADLEGWVVLKGQFGVRPAGRGANPVVGIYEATK